MFNCRTKQQHYDSLMKQTERERAENSELKVRLHRLETEVQAYISREQELLEQNQKLEAQNGHVQEEFRMAKDTFSHSQKDMDKLLSEQRLALLAEKVNVEKRLEEQEAQLAQLQQRIAMLTTAHNRVGLTTPSVLSSSSTSFLLFVFVFLFLSALQHSVYSQCQFAMELIIIRIW